MKPQLYPGRVAAALTLLAGPFHLSPCHGQSADWQSLIWREPQVRYLLADMTGGGKVEMYRKYALEERDPDSREAIRLWDAGVRAVNMADFERRWITNQVAKDGRAFRVVLRGTDRTISGNEVVLSNDGATPQGPLRLALLGLSLGGDPRELQGRSDPALVEALRRFEAGCRVINPHVFERGPAGRGERPVLAFKGTGQPADPAFIRLNSDLPYPENNVRYFMIDVALGGSLEFYRRVAEEAHEMGCQEAVRRIEEGFRVTNTELFERKQVDGKTLISRKGSNLRISGSEVKLSSD